MGKTIFIATWVVDRDEWYMLGAGPDKDKLVDSIPDLLMSHKNFNPNSAKDRRLLEDVTMHPYMVDEIPLV